MAISITKIGGSLKVDDSLNKKYYPLEGITFSTSGTNLILFHQLKQVGNFAFADFTAPSGSNIEEIANSIAVLIKSNENLPLSAFGDLRVTELSPIIQYSFEYTVTNEDIGTITVENTGTTTQASGMCVVQTGTTTASSAKWKTKKQAKYRAGLGGLFRGTALFTTGTDGTEQMLGLADEVGSSASHKNGYAVGYNGAIFSFMRWQNDVLIPVAQGDWDDPMDGTGESGMTLDPTKLNVYFIQFQYLGAGAITLWIEDESTGLPVKAHTILYANLNITPSIFNPNFHIMLHVLNDGTTDDLIAKSSSMAYFVEGKTKLIEVHQPQFSTGKKEKTTVTTEVAIFTIRNKTTYASKANFLEILLENIGVSIEASAANNLGNIRVVKNTTLGGTPDYSDINTNNSIVEIDTSGTTLTGGTEMFNIPLAGKNDKELIDVTPYSIVIEPGETITISGLSDNSATINGSLLWKELF